MKPRVTAEELAEVAGISVATLFKTAKLLREVLERAAKFWNEPLKMKSPWMQELWVHERD